MLKRIKEWLLNRLDSFWDKRIDVPAMEEELSDYVRNINPVSTPFKDAIKLQQAEWAANNYQSKMASNLSDMQNVPLAMTNQMYSLSALNQKVKLSIEHTFKLAQIDRDIEMLRSKILKAKKQKKRRSDLDKQHQELVRQRLEADIGSGHGSV